MVLRLDNEAETINETRFGGGSVFHLTNCGTDLTLAPG
jgi:hypothetical protein